MDKIRKLSVTCSLSDPKDYKGGELEFDFRNTDPDGKPILENVLKYYQEDLLLYFHLMYGTELNQ
jgi:hypothetical protein